MSLYHVSRSGEPGICRARPGSCPLDSLEGQAHGSKSEVLAAIEKFHGGVTPSPISKASGESKTLALRDELLRASRAYYYGGESPLTDEQYDDKLAYLKYLARENHLELDSTIQALLDGKVAAGIAAPDSTRPSRRLPMLSQRKADTREEVQDYLTSALAAGATGFKLQAKLDGISFAAIYVGGELRHCTGRGDGARGQDYTSCIRDGSVKVEGLPLKLEGPLALGTVELRGELFVRNSEFERANAERSEAGAPPVGHPQIMTSSAMNRGSSSAVLTFVVFNKVAHEEDGERFDAYEALELESAGFNEIGLLTEREWKTVRASSPDFSSLTDIESLMGQIDEFGALRPHLDVPTDGIVVKPLNELELLDRMGSTAHHPRSQVAFKYTGAMGVAPVEALSWTVRGNGEIAAQLSFATLELGGKRFGRTSLPYATLVEEVGLGPGSEVLIEKYRDQAAKFRSVQAPGTSTYEVPTFCPSCSSPLEKVVNRPDPGNRLPASYTSLHCASQTCPDRIVAAYGRGGVEYEGLGPAKVKALYEAGLIGSTADIARLDSPDAFLTPAGTYPKGFTKNNVGKLATAVVEGRAKLHNNVRLGLASLHLYGLTKDRVALIADTYESTAAIERADVRELTECFVEDLHETEQTNMLDTPEACAARLQAQLRESIALKSYRAQGVVF